MSKKKSQVELQDTKRKCDTTLEYCKSKLYKLLLKNENPDHHNTVKVKILLSGKTLNADMDFMDHLKKHIKLQPVSSVNECDVILIFCPVVSRAATDIKEAMTMLQNIADPEPAVLVVLHHTFDPDCVVPESRRAVNRENMITVDCLFHERQGLLQCQRNYESLFSVKTYLQDLTKKQITSGLNMNPSTPEQKTSPQLGNKCFILKTGKTLNAYQAIMEHLTKQISDLQLVSSVNECDFILIFCPVVSRAATDIKEAMTMLQEISDTKPAVLVVLHHTFDPDCVVPESRRAVNRENMIAVDCLFHERQGLLQCPNNVNAIDRIKQWRQLESRMLAGGQVHQKTPKQMTVSLSLVLLGRTESGKSKAGKTILGREERNFTSPSTETPSISTQQSESTQGQVAGRNVIVVDTPDWFNPKLPMEQVEQDVRRCVRLSAPGPHAFLVVIPVKQPTGEETEETGMLEKIENIFGEECWKNTLILFTVTTEYQKKYIQMQGEHRKFEKFLEKCGNRFHCVNVMENVDDSQVTQLINMIEKMVEDNGGNFYCSEIHQEIREMEKNIFERYIRDFKMEIQSTGENIEKLVERFSQYRKLKPDRYDGEGWTGQNKILMKCILPEVHQTLWAEKMKGNQKITQTQTQESNQSDVNETSMHESEQLDKQNDFEQNFF